MLSNGIAKLVTNRSLGTYYCEILSFFVVVTFIHHKEENLNWLQVK